MDRGKMIYTELNGIRYGKSYGVFYRYLHRRLWNWLADTHGRKYKKDWPEWAINGGICGSWIAAYTYTAGIYDLKPGYSERIARAIAEAPIKTSYRGRILEYDSDYLSLKGTL